MEIDPHFQHLHLLIYCWLQLITRVRLSWHVNYLPYWQSLLSRAASKKAQRIVRALDVIGVRQVRMQDLQLDSD